MTPAHLDDIIRTHDRCSRERPLAILRDRAYWEYLIERSRSFFSRLDGTDLSSRFQVVLRDGEFAGYLATVDGGDVWIVREIEVVDDDPQSFATVLAMGASQARSRGRRRWYSWLPREGSAATPGVQVRFRPRGRAIPMLRRLDGGEPSTASAPPDATFIPYLDQF